MAISKPLPLEDAKALVLAYNESTQKVQDEITKHYRSARHYYAAALRDVMLMVAPEDSAAITKFVEDHLLAWPVAKQ